MINVPTAERSTLIQTRQGSSPGKLTGAIRRIMGKAMMYVRTADSSITTGSIAIGSITLNHTTQDISSLFTGSMFEMMSRFRLAAG